MIIHDYNGFLNSILGLSNTQTLILFCKYHSKSKRISWAWHIASMQEKRNAYTILVGKLEGKSPLGRPRHKWEDNIKINLRERG
jgi:hypothetical protein